MKKFFAVLLVLLMMISCAALADKNELEVSGSATVYMEADQVSACIGLNITGEDLGALQVQANETLAAIYSSLQDAGLDLKDISTNYIYMSPRYDYSGETEEIIGYSINHSLLITTDELDKIGIFIDAAFASGANILDSVNFSASDSSEATHKALELAVKNAREKAEIIASASGRILGEVLEIREGESNSNYYGEPTGAHFAMAESSYAAAGTTVRASQVSVTSNVSITYELK